MPVRPRRGTGGDAERARWDRLAVQGLILHLFWADAYDVDVPAERGDEVQIRPVQGIVPRSLELDPRPLVERREPRDRFLGNCRHFSTLTVALLRRAGVASRARCGFARYFEPGKWVDHWIVEHWDGRRWIMLDAQVVSLQRQAIALGPDPTDLPEGYFLPAGAAWQRCQAGEEDADSFGILDMWGQGFIKGNIARDLAALNKVEMLPWDAWGPLAGTDAYVDEVADPLSRTTFGPSEAATRRRSPCVCRHVSQRCSPPPARWKSKSRSSRERRRWSLIAGHQPDARRETVTG
jgi:hypothetical protein